MGGDRIYWQPVRRLITSGNIINVKNALAIGGFNEELFIDEVDYDICYRGTEMNLAVFECTEGIYLRHSVGKENKDFWAYIPLYESCSYEKILYCEKSLDGL